MAKVKAQPIKFIEIDDVIIGIVDLANNKVRFVDAEYAELPSDVIQELLGSSIASLIQTKE